MKARTVNFNDFNSLDDLNITLLTVEIEGAKPKISTTEIPYSSTVLDFTEAYGRVNYKSREISMGFHIPLFADHFGIWSNVANKLNGQRMKITFSADESYYWIGRIVVGALQMDDERWGFDITAEVDPFKYKHTVTTVTCTGSPDGTAVTLANSKAPAEITVQCEEAVTLTYGTMQVAVASGTHTLPEITLSEGNNELTVKSDNETSVTITYREGKL